MSLEDQGIFVRYVSMPFSVRGVTIPNPDMTFDIYINDQLPTYMQFAALNHEINHIHLDHLYKHDEDVALEELAANLNN